MKANENEKEYYTRYYSTSDDIYTSFIELSQRISRLDATVSLIIPITWLTGSNYSHTRKLLSTEFSLIKAINLPYDIFTDAYVDTGLYFFKRASVDKALVYEFSPRTKAENEMLKAIQFNTLSRQSWEKNQDLRININEGGNPIFAKLDSFPNTLDNYSISARGILANKQDYLAHPSDETDKKVFVGNLDRYFLDKKYCFIKYGENLERNQRAMIFLLEKGY